MHLDNKRGVTKRILHREGYKHKKTQKPYNEQKREKPKKEHTLFQTSKKGNYNGKKRWKNQPGKNQQLHESME